MEEPLFDIHFDQQEETHMKKALSVLVAVILALCMSGAALAEGTTYQIGICQLVQHVALDAATQGFQDALTEKLGDAVAVGKVNVDDESDLAARFGIQSIPTLLLFRKGELVNRSVGVIPAAARCLQKQKHACACFCFW